MRSGHSSEVNRENEFLIDTTKKASPFEKWKNTSPGVPGGVVVLAVSTLGLVALIVTLIEGLTSDYDNCVKRQNNHGPNVHAEKDSTLQIESSNTFKIANCTGLSDTLSKDQTDDVIITTSAIIFSTLIATAAIYVAAKALNCYRNSWSSSATSASDVEASQSVDNTELVSIFLKKENTGYGSNQTSKLLETSTPTLP